MLTQLSTVKARLQITDPGYDDILTKAIVAYSDRFDTECNRQFARQENTTDEVRGNEIDICVTRYPIESVASFQVKSTEAVGWQTVTPTPSYLMTSCAVTLLWPLGSVRQRARVTYTGGYVLPGTTPAAGETPLPADLEQACIEQVAYWFLNRTTPGLISVTVTSGTRIQTVDLLPSVTNVLRKYRRMTF